MEEATYYLEQVTITEESEDGYSYEEVPLDDYDSIVEGEEDFEKAVHAVQEQTEAIQAVTERPVLVSKYPVSHKPEVVDDFLRNFLIKMGMMKTLDCFQTEWYEMMHKNQIKSEDAEFVPDVYTHNQLLDNDIRRLKKELDKYKEAAINAKESLVKLQKERDFHRMHHKRVVQEKNRLINDIKRLQVCKPLLKIYYLDVNSRLLNLKMHGGFLLR
ncbi:sperm-associated antigen 16 protein isoform X2 [Protopterus annectens]|uniref:sperm-associated antigen 16 protein isoform X2 n=1 Tax=Protopterus annectens TaxID=7888 RepID=UPI001CFBDC94|nr:sperm-associated antigen 16 protein isoform X2 [Protopterus annectens]